jgi:hypothetical protein
MAHHELVLAFGIIAALSPASAQSPDPMPAASAPTGDADALYCLKVGPITGTRLERVVCWTRQQWTDQDVDLDKEWADEGVAVISNGVRQPASS